MYILVQRKSEASDMHNNDKDRHAALLILEVCGGGGEGAHLPKGFQYHSTVYKGGVVFIFIF